MIFTPFVREVHALIMNTVIHMCTWESEAFMETFKSRNRAMCLCLERRGSSAWLLSYNDLSNLASYHNQ